MIFLRLSSDFLYTGSQNLGAANLIFPKETSFNATMTCFPYDDLEYWRENYPKEVFLGQFGFAKNGRRGWKR